METNLCKIGFMISSPCNIGFKLNCHNYMFYHVYKIGFTSIGLNVHTTGLDFLTGFGSADITQFHSCVFFGQDDCNWAFFVTSDITWIPTHVKLDL